MEKEIVSHPNRVVEAASLLPGARLERIFALLLPIWEVEITAVVRRADPYAVFDHYVTRAIGEAQLKNAAEIAEFFAVPTNIVDRTLNFLTDLGHLDADGRLTELGQVSLNDGVRYSVTEDRMALWIDGTTNQPALQAHYRHSLVEEPFLKSGGMEFTPIAANDLQLGIFPRLAQSPDPTKFNIPDGLQQLTPITARLRWVPVYILPQRDAYPLAYLGTRLEPDPWAARIAQHLMPVLRAERAIDTRDRAEQWLARQDVAGVVTGQTSERIRVAFAPDDFRDGGIKPTLLGAFRFDRGAIWQIWCEDEDARRSAAATRIRAYAKKVPDRNRVEEKGRELAQQLDLADFDVDSAISRAM